MPNIWSSFIFVQVNLGNGDEITALNMLSEARIIQFKSAKGLFNMLYDSFESLCIL